MIDLGRCDDPPTIVPAESQQRLRALLAHRLHVVSRVEAESNRGFTTWLTLESCAGRTESSLRQLQRSLVAAQGICEHVIVDDWRRIVQKAVDQLHNQATGGHPMPETAGRYAAPRLTD